MTKRGVLVMAHGSSRPEWVRMVDEAVAQVRLDEPVVTSYLELVEGRTIQDGIDALKRKGVTEVTAVPLFVSSGSMHIEELRYFLGLTKTPQIRIEKEPFAVEDCVQMTRAMDDHSLIAEILADRVRDLSENPMEEALLLVGHGSNLPGFQEMWEQSMESLARKLQEAFGFAATATATILPDNLRERLVNLSRCYRVLVLPLFLSEGYFTRKVIPSRMEGQKAVYNGKAYLPHPLIPRWIEEVVKTERGVIKAWIRK